jgi:hypothetical protein
MSLVEEQVDPSVWMDGSTIGKAKIASCSDSPKGSPPVPSPKAIPLKTRGLDGSLAYHK